MNEGKNRKEPLKRSDNNVMIESDDDQLRDDAIYGLLIEELHTTGEAFCNEFDDIYAVSKDLDHVYIGSKTIGSIARKLQERQKKHKELVYED